MRRVWLALGAFGGELVLLLALPAIGHLYGASAVALLSIATVAANCGKLLGCLKLDAAIANADDARIAGTHAAALVAVAASSLLCLLVFAVLDATALLPRSAAAIGAPVCAAFTGGAIQQSATMRLLRESRLGLFALLKALPSLMLVVVVFLVSPASLPVAYMDAFAATALAVAALYLRMPQAGMLPRIRLELAASRSFMLKGAPAAALDGGNMFLLSVLTIAMAGTHAAGEAAQLQRVALAPSLAASLLLSQHVWGQRFDEDSAAAWREDRRRVVLRAAAAALASALLLFCLLATSLGRRLLPVGHADALAVLACLCPLLAQYTGSPLTVYFFKRSKLHTYAHLQLALLASLGMAAVASWFLPPGGGAQSVALLLLAAVILVLTLGLSRRAVSP